MLDWVGGRVGGWLAGGMSGGDTSPLGVPVRRLRCQSAEVSTAQIRARCGDLKPRQRVVETAQVGWVMVGGLSVELFHLELWSNSHEKDLDLRPDFKFAKSTPHWVGPIQNCW